jgi:hypothetical protein
LTCNYCVQIPVRGLTLLFWKKKVSSFFNISEKETINTEKKGGKSSQSPLPEIKDINI